MPPAQDFRQTVIEELQDPKYRRAYFCEMINALLRGDLDAAKSALRIFMKSQFLRAAAILMLLFALPLWAKEKSPHEWADGTLISFQDVNGGVSCSNNGTVENSDQNKARYSGSSDCSTSTYKVYTVQINGNSYSVRHVLKFLEPGISRGVLYNLMPNAHFEAWLDGSKFHIRVGKKESLFLIVEAGKQ